MFNRKLFGLLTSLYLARAASYDACTSACGSAANSTNPYGDMNKLLQSGANCQSTYTPLAPQPNQYGYGSGNEGCTPSYYPQPMNREQGGFFQGYPPMGGGTSTPLTGMTNNNTGNEECEVTTSIECKPKRGGQNQPPTYSYGPSSVMPQMFSGTSSTRPSTVPGSNQACDCSQLMGGSNNYGYQPISQGFGGNSNMGGCDCSQMQMPGQQPQMPGGNNTTMPGNFTGQTRPQYCGENGGRGGPFEMGFMGGRSSGSVFDSFDCSRPQTYQLPPVKTAIVGTSELPVSDNVRITASSCGPAPCL